MNNSILQECGLTKSETKIYLALLNIGPSQTGQITKASKLHRSRVYESLSRLIDKGLVSYTIRNYAKVFTASSPESILHYLEEQKSLFAEKERKIKRIIPELGSLNVRQQTAESFVLVGKEGFKTMRKEVLKDGADLYLIGAKGKEDKVLKHFFPNFEKLRLQKKIKLHVLFDHEVTGGITKLKLMEFKYLPRGFSTPTVINIYSDNVVNVLWRGDEPICFQMRNKTVADSYRKWFSLLWKAARR